MKIPFPSPRSTRGFALVVTLSLMILLAVLAVGLLSLSGIALRSSTGAEAEARAYSNARMAVMMAIAELQKHAGDDRRITADASILSEDTPLPHMVGVWKSWTPGMVNHPGQKAPDYDEPKTDGFLTWLVSSPDVEETGERDWHESAASEEGNDWVSVFSAEKNGFDLNARLVEAPKGAMAWAVSQENTKAKINVGGRESEPDPNVVLHAQRRPSLALSKALKQPEKDWNLRSGRLCTIRQMQLDPALDASDPATAAIAGASYTVHSQGLLSDVVHGGLKTDLSLGFELGDADFASPSWSGIPNPFRTPRAEDLEFTPASYEGQQALFRPLEENPIVSSMTNYGVASLSFRFYAAAVPTFDHLRSFYRIPHHLYGGASPVVAGRGQDHVASVTEPAARRTYLAPYDSAPGDDSRLGIRPVLNRMIYLLSAKLDERDRVRLVITPVISLWNPYNVSLEIDGAVAYPWMDLPFQLIWERKSVNEPVVTEPIGMADAMGKQFEDRGQSRQVDPYFFCELTANGDGNTSRPIRFQPGEVRVFYPAASQPTEFVRRGTNKQRTLRMRPAEDIGGVNKRGGFEVSMQQADGLAGHGLAEYFVKRTDEIRVAVKDISNIGAGRGQYHYFVTLEDSSRINNPSDDTRGQAVTDVQILNLISAENSIRSPWRTYEELKNGDPIPFGVIETFHRTALNNVGGQAVSDLIYTTNPRQPSINHQLANGSFAVAPHFQSTLRSTPSFDTAIQTTFDGRGSFWGASHSSSGRSHLPFFEIPRSPLLSLAAFQHADLSSSTFAPAHQFGNSWASAYLAGNQVAYVKPGASQLPTVPIYDSCFLANEALWDGFFFSGAAPRLQPASSGRPSTAWDSPIAMVEKPLSDVVRGFVEDPVANPLPSNRMRLFRGGQTDDEIVDSLLSPAGCVQIAAHLMVDGAFNVNSTDVEAWASMLSGLRGEPFVVDGGAAPPADNSPMPRFRNPSGKANDNWNGFRTLDDAQVRKLAENLVDEIRKRGPFLSLAEFVNRRAEDGQLGRSGAIQAAIESDALNKASEQAKFSTENYPPEARPNIINDTGTGIPGYLTQADVLQSLAPVITCRSDTFTVRGYGEARDASGKVIARSWCEAVVQRVPSFVNSTDEEHTAIKDLSPVNERFGRRFEIVSFRRIPKAEI